MSFKPRSKSRPPRLERIAHEWKIAPGYFFDMGHDGIIHNVRPAPIRIPTPAPLERTALTREDGTPRGKPGPPEKYPWSADPFIPFYVQGRSRRTLENLARRAGRRYHRRFSVRRVPHERARAVFMIVLTDSEKPQTQSKENENATTLAS